MRTVVAPSSLTTATKHVARCRVCVCLACVSLSVSVCLSMCLLRVCLCLSVFVCGCMWGYVGVFVVCVCDLRSYVHDANTGRVVNGRVTGLHVEYAERRIKCGILFICSLCYAYINLECVRIHVVYSVNQAEYAMHILVAASQEYVNTYSIRRVTESTRNRMLGMASMVSTNIYTHNQPSPIHTYSSSIHRMRTCGRVWCCYGRVFVSVAGFSYYRMWMLWPSPPLRPG